MTEKQAEKLKDLFHKGFEIIISNDCYTDGFIKEISVGPTRELVYSSDSFTGRPLRQVPAESVRIYEDVTDMIWQNFSEL